MNTLKGYKKYSVLGFSGVLTLVFLLAGGAKIIGVELVAQSFEGWGYPPFFMYVIGFAEIILAIGLWLRKTAGFAALGLVGIMVGAVGTHLMFGETGRLAVPIALGVMATIVFWFRHLGNKGVFVKFGNSAPAKS